MKIKLLFLYALLAITCSLTTTAREVKSWNSGWQFKKGPFSSDPSKAVVQWNGKWGDVTLPHTWNAKDMQNAANAFYQGVSYYRKLHVFDASYKRKRVFLRFEGVGAVADVYVNGSLVGSHRGGYSAFTYEITRALKLGEENEILVKADNASRPDVIPTNHNLFGVYGGIYRPVWLIVTEQSNITPTDCASSGVYITQKNVSRRSADVTVRVKLDNGGFAPETLELENTIYTQEGHRITSHKQQICLTPQGTQTYVSNFHLSKPHLWQGRKDPYLYKVVSTLRSGGMDIDHVAQPLGLRKFEIVAGKGFYLNGERYPMYGVTRHQDWQGLGSALTNREHDTDLAMIMDIGATTVRFAHYQQSEYLYSRCDSLGLVIWAEIPFVNRVTGQEAENAQTQLRELIRQNFNHPSIYVWGMHNEVYRPHEYTASLTQTLHNLAKTEDPDRFTVAVNGYGSAEHPVNQNADIQGMNRYFGWYEKSIPDIEPWVKGLEEKYPWQKLMLTEYGTDANIEHQTEYLGESLDWTQPFYPETFQTKTHEYQWGVIAKHPYIIASYLWNMFDFACPMWSRGGVAARNLKGLVTFDRQTKKDSYYWYKANWSKQPVLYLTQRRNRQRERRVTSITVYSNIGQPHVYLNSTELTSIRRGHTDVHYIIENVELKEGINKIRTTATYEGKEYSDEIEWVFTEEFRRSTDSRASDTEHAGW